MEPLRRGKQAQRPLGLAASHGEVGDLTASRARKDGISALLPRLLLLEEEHRLKLIEAERASVTSLVDDLAGGKLSWDVDELQRLAAAPGHDLAKLARARQATTEERQASGWEQPPGADPT